MVEGTARLVDDAATRAAANAGSAFPRDEHFALFEVGVEAAMSTVYAADGRPRRERWRIASSAPAGAFEPAADSPFSVTRL